MYATRSRRVKTDKCDARALCEACKLGAYRAIHRVSDTQRHVRAELAVRDAVVRTGTRYVALIKAAVRREGLRLGQGNAERTAAQRRDRRRRRRPPARRAGPRRRPGATARDHADDRSGDRTRLRVGARRRHALRGAAPSRSIPGPGPQRTEFGEQQRRGRITKRGNTRTRWLLVEAAWRIRRSKAPALAPLNAWADLIAARPRRSVGSTSSIPSQELPLLLGRPVGACNVECRVFPSTIGGEGLAVRSSASLRTARSRRTASARHTDGGRMSNSVAQLPAIIQHSVWSVV